MREYTILLDDGEEIVVAADTIAEAIMEAIDRGEKVVNARYAA